MHSCIETRTHVANTSADLHACTHTHTLTQTCTCIQAHTQIHTHIHHIQCTCTFTFTIIITSMCTHTRTNTRAHTHASPGYPRRKRRQGCPRGAFFPTPPDTPSLFPPVPRQSSPHALSRDDDPNEAARSPAHLPSPG